ncbi:MAG: NADH-dependent alcohol dehydrogenase, partial [Myxococcota bacterium]|nr:NADH-dependent alcohol dehydrogenase [Myxococcota bacterium]
TSRISGLESCTPADLDCALAGIDRFESFLSALGCPTRLSQLEIGEELFDRYAQDAVLVVRDKEGRLPGRPPMRQEDIVNLLRAAR